MTMQKTVIHIAGMDCPAEEQLVRMKLAGENSIEALEFDLNERCVQVIHHGDVQRIVALIGELNLGARLVASSEIAAIGAQQEKDRRLLWTVLLINLAFFIIEALYGFWAHSMGLVADSLDMLADALVYGLSLAAVGASVARQKSLAAVSGYFQLSLAVIGLGEVLRRFLGSEALPDFRVIIVVSALALVANSISLFLLQKSGNQQAHMQASMIFTSNDVIINAGVILAGVLVYVTHSGIPDLVIGAVVFAIVVRGALRILALSR